jgi:[ribosomal protein S18]-alanine N-acetyltransferase
VIAVRALTFHDLPAMTTMHAQAFGTHAWNAAMLGDSMNSTDVWGVMLEQDAEPVGFSLCQQAGDDCEILTLAVLPSRQRRGLGRHLLQAVYDAAKARRSPQIFLEVAEDNVPARRLYDSFHFAVTGKRPGYYPRAHGTVAAVLMVLKIQTL